MIHSLKELVNSKTSTEMFEFFKEELVNLYGQLSLCTSIETHDFIEFINRSNVYVYVNEKMRIIGCITLLYERKLIHNGGIVCHIEDFVVHEEHRNRGIGKSLLKHATEDAKKNNCYKIILDCSEDMIDYYEKQSFEVRNVQMAKYF